MKKEDLFKKIIEEINKNSELNDILMLICKGIMEVFKADRVAIGRFDLTCGYSSLPYIIECTANPNIIEHKDVVIPAEVTEYLGNTLLKEGKDIIFDNIDDASVPDFYRDFHHKLGTKSILNVSVRKEDNNWGILAIYQNSYYRHWTEKEIKTLHEITDYIYAALKQSQSYSTIKKELERETLLRKFVETTRSILNKEQFKMIAVREIGKAFDADRCFFVIFNKKTGLTEPPRAQYLHPDEKITIGSFYPFLPIIPDFERIIIEKGLLKYEDTEKFIQENNLAGTSQDQFYKLFNIKSDYAVPVWNTEEESSSLIVQYTREKRTLSTEEIDLLKSLGSQTAIAFQQANLYEARKKYAELFDTASDAIMLLDEKGFFDCNQSTLEIFGCSTKDEFVTKHPAEVSPDTQPDGIDSMTAANERIKTALEKGYNRFDWMHKRLDNGKAFPAEVILKVIEIKGRKVLQATVRDITERKNLFETIKQTAERERLLRSIVETIRSTLDIQEAKEIIVNEIGKTFNAERCYFRAYDKLQNKFLSPDVEYLKPGATGLSGKKVNQEGLKFFVDEAERLKITYPLIINQEFFIDRGLKGSALEEYFDQCGIKTDIAIPMWDREDELSFLVLHYKDNLPTVPEEDIELMQALAKQIIIAINHSKLYETVKQTAERESLLREIIAELRLFENIEETFNYLLSKIATIFNAARTILIEIPVQEWESLRIGYEYIRKENIPSIKNVKLPDACLEMFKDIIKTDSAVMVPDTKHLHPDNVQVQQFFETYKIRAFIGSPLIRYNHEAKLLGILFVCNDKPREWNQKEFDLLKAIDESVVNVIWEILKTIEINEIRDTFVNTLAHDLQVPIVADIKALEYVSSKPELEKISPIKEIIDEILKSDKRLLHILKRLLESYQYESGKKVLKKQKISISLMTKQSINNVSDFANTKSTTIEQNIPDNLPDISADKDEIYKLLSILLDNAITYTQNNGHITTNVKTQNNNIEICIIDNGPGISEEMKSLIFNRSEMALHITRKIGAGISLYLAKQIAEAHGGKIWYISEPGKGTTFCFSLPIF